MKIIMVYIRIHVRTCMYSMCAHVCYYKLLVLMQRHLLGAGLHELAAVVHRFLRGNGQLNTSAGNAKESEDA